MSLINILIIHFKNIETEKLYFYIKDYMWFMNTIYLLFLLSSAAVLIFYDKLNETYYTKINMEMENLIS
jgi:predicted ferric reductase